MILVTGGAGFIGCNLVKSLNRDSIDVAICDTMIGTYANRCANLQSILYSELIDPWNLNAWLDGRSLDAVVHLGAITDTTREDPEMFVVNFALPIDLFEWCTKNRVPMIYASSAATYGDGLYGFEEDRHFSALRPLNAYGWSKHCFDRWVMRHGARRSDHPPGCVGLKLFNVYGPNEFHKGHMASMVSQLIERVPHLGPVGKVSLFQSPPGRPTPRRDFVYVGNVVEVIRWFMNTDMFGLFNVGSGVSRTFEELAAIVLDRLGSSVSVEHFYMPSHIATKYQYETRADLTKLRRAGYTREFTSLEDGVDCTVSAMLSSREAA